MPRLSPYRLAALRWQTPVPAVYPFETLVVIGGLSMAAHPELLTVLVSQPCANAVAPTRRASTILSWRLCNKVRLTFLFARFSRLSLHELLANTVGFPGTEPAHCHRGAVDRAELSLPGSGLWQYGNSSRRGVRGAALC